MSTISISDTSHTAVRARAASVACVSSSLNVTPRTRLRMTERGRRVLVAVVALPIVLAVGFAALSGGAALASRDEVVSPTTFETVTVLTGDTLWSLAEEIAPGVDPRDVIDAILTLNAMPTAAITPGQTIAIPAKYSE